MKISHIILLVAVAVGIGVIVSLNTDAGTYGTLEDAKLLANTGSDKTIQVIGELTRDNAGEITGIEYEPSQDPNRFVFTMYDTTGTSFKVFYPKPKPQDFEMSEKIVVSGRYDQNGMFLADKILMKCPSKYEEEADFKEAGV